MFTIPSWVWFPSWTWIIWFNVIGITGTVAEVGLQAALNLPLGYALGFEIFVLAIAAGIATLQEYAAERREDDLIRQGKIYDLLEERFLLDEIDEELNGRG